MCGIAGFSIHPSIEVDTSTLTRMLIAGLAERGEDACGYAWAEASGAVQIVKDASPPHEFLRRIPVSVPESAREVIVHVRDHTKGRPSHAGNNHPIRHGQVVGVHNGIIQNDDLLFEQLGRRRALTGMSVDSEAIFMALDSTNSYKEAFGLLIGSYAVAFFDERRPGRLTLVRGRARPLVMGVAPGAIVFASTRHALRFAADATGLPIESIADVRCGTMMAMANGSMFDARKIRVRRFTENTPLRYSRHHPNARLARSLVLRADADGEAQTA